MKKILFLALSLIYSAISFGQDSLTVDTTSISVAHKNEFSTVKSGEFTKTVGDSAYAKNDYASAIQIYEGLLQQGESADLYYNLGNSYYKADNIAKAILNYERALLLKPGDNDIRFNLDLARSKTVDKVEPVPEIFFVTWIKSLINCMGVNAWTKLGITFFILLIISLSVFIFGKKLLIKKIGFISSIILFIFVVLTNIFASQQKDSLINRTHAIVINPSVTVKSTPNESGTDLFILHEGRKVQVTDNSMKEWKEIKLEDGNVGWVPTNVIEII